VAFRPDGKAMFTAGADGAAWLTETAQPLAGTPERLQLWIEVHTGKELDDEGRLRTLPEETWLKRRKRLQELGGSPLS
jgi:hypothetical protein